MSYSSSFRTRSEIAQCKNLNPSETAVCALDIGYSAVKGFSSTVRACIPSFVREHPAAIIGATRPTDIYYKDETGVYAVGSLAMESLSAKDTNDAANTMFSRNRYFSPSFLILARTGLAVEIGANEERPVFLQTGLPPAYRKADTPLLKEALAGKHEFSLKIGNDDWTDYSFTLDEDSIDVMDQPIGSIFSASKRSDGTTVYCDDGKTYIDHNVLVLDGGFGTLDIFSVSNRAINSTNTFNDLGMRSVFERTTQKIFELYGKEVYPHTLQQYLSDGILTVFDRKTKSTHRENITEILREANRYICEKAMTKIEAAYDDLTDYDYLLVTGGTGSAWLDILKERYKSMQTLSVVAANQNEKIPSVYNNVRGYYIYRALLSS